MFEGSLTCAAADCALNVKSAATDTRRNAVVAVIDVYLRMGY
jgi:hypothetical protein